MREATYRASRVCRVLGSPLVFAIVAALLKRFDKVGLPARGIVEI